MRLLWPSICGYESHTKTYPSFSVNNPTIRATIKTQPLDRTTHKFKLCELCQFVVLEPHESTIGRRVTIITQTLDRIRLCFRIKVRFSESFLALHRITQKERMQKSTFRRSCHALKFSPLRLVSSFWLSGHLFLVMQFISEFIGVNVRWKPFAISESHLTLSEVSMRREQGQRRLQTRKESRRPLAED